MVCRRAPGYGWRRAPPTCARGSTVWRHRHRPCSGRIRFPVTVFCFRGRRGDLVKLLWWDGDGLCLFAKRLERGRFVWPRAEEGVVVLSRAQLSMLLEGIDWRMPQRTWRPELAG